ncbi:hypothetical protein [Nonomuraea roseoviolacea]|uniref:DUF222 domain-containing protein n=1 Tax=Nonomuraea roseoviolacea subsp. carminata TaxID=160689 RepID=A0ABT1KAR1_9ACTN|nr:hypothetical protein [Nonomuraea roseoviolacea]MCP2350677.1 hypothetical protein [Nonomuraea roseoviolacea subsp. carminata]
MTAIIADQPATIELAPADILDATDAIQRLGGKWITYLTARDRQALTMLTYLVELPPYLRNTLSKFVTGEAHGLPSLATRLIQQHLPAVSDQDRREWRSTRQAARGNLDAAGLGAPSQGNPVERALRIIAARAARHHDDAVGAALRWAMQTLAAEMAHGAPSPIPDETQHAAHQHVAELVDQARTDDASERITATLAAYVDEHSCDAGGGHQRTMLLAAQIARLCYVTPDQAIDLAKHDPYDDRVKAASQARDEALARARHARENADYDETPVAVTL